MRALLFAATVAPALAAACSGASSSTGQTAWMRVQGAQYISGSIDVETRASAPQVHSISTQNNDLFPGVTGKSISGTVGPGSTAVMMGLLGDSGYWVFPVQDLDQNTPGDYTFGCSASFSPLTQTADGGGLSLVVRATNKQGEVGPALIQPIVMKGALPGGALVISLDWDTQADLDLHVVLPSDRDAGVNEIWPRKPTGLPAGTNGATFDEGTDAGYLDRDSNSMCAIDGIRVENVIFPTVAPGGHYLVRVDTFSLCGEATARWRVRVFAGDTATPTLQAFGQSTDTDTRFAHGQGAGVQALVFDYNP
jgi:hypothetical protein